jgi:hypothetical protein
MRRIWSSGKGGLRLPLAALGAAVIAGAAYIPIAAAPSGASITTTQFTVQGNVAGWQDTGVNVPFGAAVTITASGRITYNLQGGNSGPNGDPVPTEICASGVSSPWAANDLPCLSLIGNLGGASFEVGSSFVSRHTEGGELSLAYNDNLYTDNSGSFTVDITVNTGAAAATDVSSNSAATPTAGSHSFNVTVPGNSAAPVDTGIYVPAFKTVTISASGSVAFNAQGQSTGPAGLVVPTETCVGGSGIPWFDNDLNCLSLIGLMGDSPAFQVGPSFIAHDVEGGELYLLYNDNEYGDNTGSFDVTVTVS